MISLNLPDTNAGKMKLKSTWCGSKTSRKEQARLYRAKIRNDPERYADYLAKKRAWMKRYNDKRTPENRELYNLHQRIYEHQKRAKMTPEELWCYIKRLRQREQEKRDQMTTEERLHHNKLKCLREQKRRDQMTTEERLHHNKLKCLREQKRRAKKKREGDVKKSGKSEAKTTTPREESRIEDGDGHDSANHSDTHGMSDWSPEEKGQLLQAMASQCLVKDTVSFAAGANKLDWGAMGMEGRSPRQCRAAWDHMLAKVCKHRTLLEVLKDAESHLLHPQTLKIQGNIKHPDQPKKPLTAYFQFVQNRRDKVKAKHPELTNIELTRLMSQRWKDLDLAKRSKYIQRYREQWSEFQEGNAKFLEEHPELNNKPTKPKRPSPLGLFSQAKLQKVSDRHPQHPDQPKKPLTAYFQFVQNRRDKVKAKHPELTNIELTRLMSQRWKDLDLAKRSKYIQRYKEQWSEFQEENAKFLEEHPELNNKPTKPKRPSPLGLFSQAKLQKVSDRHPQHPDQPKRPLTAYFQFVQNRRDKVKAKYPELTNIELTRLMSQRWKDLDLAKRSKYIQRYKEQWSEFQEENAKFLEEHPELNNKPTKPKRPSPLGLFSQAKLQKVSDRHPQLDKSGLQRKLRKKYKKLSADKRKTWVQKAVDAVAQYEREVSHYLTHHPGFVPPLKKIILTHEEQSLIGDEDRQSSRSATRKKRVFPGAPDKPPRSAFQLYVKRKMGGMEEVSMGDRMKALGLQWRELGTKQQKYDKKLRKLRERYSQELDLFRQSLAEDDLEEFEKSLLPNKKPRHKENEAEKKGSD